MLIRAGQAAFAGLVEAESLEWQTALARTTHDFYHLPDYTRLCAKRDHGVARAYVEFDAEFAMLVPMSLIALDSLGLEGYFHAQSPYGYPGPALSRGVSGARLRKALGHMTSELHERRVMTFFSRLHPLLPFPLAELDTLGALVTHGETVSLDLAAPLELSWSQIRETHRRHIMRARRQGYQTSDSWEHLASYQSAYTETMRRVGAGGQYDFDLEYVAALRRALGDRLHLFSLLKEGQVACGGLFTETDGLVQYHLGGTRDAFLADSPIKLLFDEVRIWGHERGFSTLHLGGGVGARADSLFEFKAGFSERRHAFRTLRLAPDPTTYERFCLAHGLTPSLAGHFPAFALPVPNGNDEQLTDPWSDHAQLAGSTPSEL